MNQGTSGESNEHREATFSERSQFPFQSYEIQANRNVREENVRTMFLYVAMVIFDKCVGLVNSAQSMHTD